MRKIKDYREKKKDGILFKDSLVVFALMSILFALSKESLCFLKSNFIIFIPSTGKNEGCYRFI
ncbi:MAG: hypothetical protein CMP59_01970 [Flavobacteriales bacterium]|nr:hypothetical protein [Flavobacteriales bacterium]